MAVVGTSIAERQKNRLSSPGKERPFLICRRSVAARAKLRDIAPGNERPPTGNSRLSVPPAISKWRCHVNMLEMSFNQLLEIKMCVCLCVLACAARHQRVSGFVCGLRDYY
jgi:hypothetical protein